MRSAAPRRCEPFRRALLAYYAEVKDTMEENLLMCLAELFEQISTSKKRTGVIAPRRVPRAAPRAMDRAASGVRTTHLDSSERGGPRAGSSCRGFARRTRCSATTTTRMRTSS